MEEVNLKFVETLIRHKKTHVEISDILKAHFPSKRGFSARSVRRYCSKYGIKGGTNQTVVEELVSKAIGQVG